MPFIAYVSKIRFTHALHVCGIMILDLSSSSRHEFCVLCVAKMKTVEHIREFLDAFIAWAADQLDVQGIALVGSYARGAARADSESIS